MLDIVFGESTDPGKLRKVNEDAMGVFVPEAQRQARSHGWLFVLADGVGGLDFGDVASLKTVAVLTEGFALAPANASLVTLLPDLIRRSNAIVHDELLHPQRRGKRMATTVVACALRQNQAVVAHVGDSRCYLIRSGEIVFSTSDHTFATEQQSLGLITKAELADSEMNHILTRSVGAERSVQVDVATLSLEPGDLLMLCSDGLYKGMYDEEIVRIATQNKNIHTIAQELVQYSVDADGSDNTSAQLIFVRSVESIGMYRGRPYRLHGS